MSDLSVEHVRVPTNGIHLHCAVSGSGPLLLMLHGFPKSWRSWSAQMSALAPRFKVVAPDLRGFGDSDKPDDGYDPWTLAEDIAGLIDVFGGGKRAHGRGSRLGRIHRLGMKLSPRGPLGQAEHRELSASVPVPQENSVGPAFQIVVRPFLWFAVVA